MNKRFGIGMAALALVAVAEIGQARHLPPAPQPGPCFNVKRRCQPIQPSPCSVTSPSCRSGGGSGTGTGGGGGRGR